MSLVDGLEAGLLARFGMERSAAEGRRLIVVTVMLALFTIIFAELIPKAIALANAERFAIVLSRPIDFLARSPWPARRVPDRHHALGRAADRRRHDQEAQISAEELRLIVERGGEQGVLEAEEEQMINAVIELGERRVHEVMVPRVAIAALAADGDVRAGDRHGRRGRPQPDPGLRGSDRRDRRHPLREGPAAVPRRSRGPAAGAPHRCCGTPVSSRNR